MIDHDDEGTALRARRSGDGVIHPSKEHLAKRAKP
jgi:hypothetical protein